MLKTSNLLGLVVGISLVGLSGCGGEVATLEFVAFVPANPKIGEVTTVQFKVTDYRGSPLAGQSVTFRLDDTTRPNVKLDPPTGTSIKGTGLVSTQLTVSALQAVRVIAVAGNKEVSSPAIGFAGGQASGRQFTFQCGKLSGDGSGGLHAIGAYDPSRYLIAGVKLPCIAHVADRDGDGLAGAVVNFMTEAGTIGASGTSVADIVGNAEVLYKSSLPLPKELPPGVFIWNPPIDELHTGEYLVPLWMEPYRWTTNPIGTIDSNVPPFNPNNLQEPRRPDPIRIRPDMIPAVAYQNNPRDNLVAIIAFTAGEEGYTDINRNRKHDMGEPIDDLTEPFIDSDDNGTRDPDEKFFDVNGDEKWNGKNGQWDENTVIWAQERILWTGVPNDEDRTPSARNPVPSVRGVTSATGSFIQISCGGFAAVDFIIADPWWNSLARNGDGDGCKGESNESVKVIGGSQGTAFTYPAGSTFAFGVSDNLDRKPAPMVMPPQPTCVRPPGDMCTAMGPECQGFAVPVVCSFTASPVEGHIVNILDVIQGRIFKNFP